MNLWLLQYTGKEPTANDLPDLYLPVSLRSITKYHGDFVKCEDQATANRVMEQMQDHCMSELAKVGCEG